MNILVVGNVLKDVYLNLDTRTEHLEVDERNTPWLNLGFNASEHYFFSRNSSLGGAAVSLEVFSKMGLKCNIVGSDIHMANGDLISDLPTETYRYILIANGKVSYLAPSIHRITNFTPPAEPVDYIYIDRSAKLTADNTAKIEAYLDISSNTKLALYIQHLDNPHLRALLPRATFIFLEDSNNRSELSHALSSAGLDESNIFHLSETALHCKDIVEKISLQRVDVTTHLSAYSIAAATILGGLVLGHTTSEALILARINMEHSKLNSSLDLATMQDLASSTPSTSSLELIAASLVRPGKGILAADESGGSIKKKFAKLNIPDTYDTRRDYRNIFFTTPDIEKYLTGTILFDETAHQYADNGQTFTDYLTTRRIIPGIKVDQGLQKLDNSLETYTKGLGGLYNRLITYYTEGLRFAKWRAAFEIHLSTDGIILTPTIQAISRNCKDLAEYARICQAANIVPIVEPEVVYSGYYSINDSAKVTGQILDTLFAELKKAGVNLRACILKVNMIIVGKYYPHQSTATEVGQATADTLRTHVPADLAGVVFLSGGQTPEQATANLAAITREGPLPWPVTFSFARALQDPALYAWAGDNTNADKARKAFLERVIANTDALKASVN